MKPWSWPGGDATRKRWCSRCPADEQRRRRTIRYDQTRPAVGCVGWTGALPTVTRKTIRAFHDPAFTTPGRRVIGGLNLTANVCPALAPNLRMASATSSLHPCLPSPATRGPPPAPEAGTFPTNHKSVAHIQRIRFNIVRWIEICGLDKSNTGIAEPNRPDSEPGQCYGNNIPTGFVLLHFQITCNLSV